MKKSLALLLALFTLAACAHPALPGETKTAARLDAAQQKQLSAAAASVEAAKFANQANPDGLPKTATAGELNVADANLPEPKPEDAREALARVNAALTGKLAEAQKGWDSATTAAAALSDKVSQLQKQVIAERAAAAAEAQKARDRLCIIAALIVGGVLGLAAALALAAGMYFGLPKLELGALGLGLCGALTFFAGTQVGSTHFNILATVTIATAVAAGIYTVWNGFSGGSVIQAKAGGFDAAISGLRKFAGQVAGDVETDATAIWHWFGTELDAAHKALVKDWDKLESLFTPKPPPYNPASAGAPTLPAAA